MTNLEKYLRITNDIKQSVIDMNDLLAVHSFIESRVTDRQLSTVKNCAKLKRKEFNIAKSTAIRFFFDIKRELQLRLAPEVRAVLDKPIDLDGVEYQAEFFSQYCVVLISKKEIKCMSLMKLLGKI